MRRILIFLYLICHSLLICKAQDFPDISNEEIESSREYINGNKYQKDLLLYSKTFERTHPFYANPKRAKELNLDAIHDTVHEMARDEARHGKAFEGLLKRYFS